MTGAVHLGVALEGYGWHPEAWRHTTATAPVTGGRYWTELATTAERGLLDFVTFDDSLTAQRRRRAEIDARWLAGRPDAVLVAARVAPVTRHIGLIPVANTTHTEPFHVSKAIATLDFVSHGRAGWQVRVSASRHEAELFGRRDPDALGDLFDEAADAVGVVRRLWDSWEDDAVIRDTATGRFVDRDKLHYIDFAGPFFSVKGPSITPRPPQGQPVVTALAHNRRVYEFAAGSADLVFVTPAGDDAVTAVLDEVALAGGGRLLVYADLYVTFAGLVDERSDAEVFAGTPAQLADTIERWHRLGVDGVRLRPAVNSADLPVIVDEVVPILQQRGVFRTAYSDGESLRHRLGLPTAGNRYAAKGNS
ncbi:LLM class flavin-dependent oxidoreductase [Mycolicibacterium vaccae]|uniref:F420-dependent methylene-tetrahydromethanopterin reductase n=1 Tax=Mycolicibacterium vaccae ATCC 25954 TaxID=1194972 RepID=K0UUK9_MYCVA|nr:LLM class flavin-dependent oxidoreductase [Mycolicibacterium vaccae]ANI37794.1 FMNH2-utilizing oxygenase [Mycolicibacterium vaccae 95051]EJZ08710.1 F420-dependent methylene-tetrahydromethanopterin reductase [Mycolicibacterium vaccae ATCC 25954]MCV7060804.1 LLM class flavin-dependent oxidoreductase [Mycolicibacterium vaccae]